MMALARLWTVVPDRTLVGAAIGVGFAAASVGLALWKAPEPYRLALGLGYFGVLAWIAAHDAETMRSPNRVIYPALAVAVVASLLLGWDDAREALLGGALSFTAFLVLAFLGRGALGAGDVKVGALCGLAVGLHGVMPMLLLTFIAGGVTAAPLLLFGMRRGRDKIAFTPFLVGATILCTAYFRLYLWG